MIIFAAVFILAFFILKTSIASADPGKYEKVTIEKGDTLWQIAGSHKQQSHMSRSRFIRWVEKMNQVKSDELIPGETIMIPVKKP